MYIPLSDDKHRKVRDCSKNALEIWDKFSLRQNSVPRIMVGKKSFIGMNFVWDWILSRTDFCLGLILYPITYRSCISYAIF